MLKLASVVFATLCVSTLAAHSKTCIRDLAGQIICGELVETRDDPGDQADSRQDDSRDLRSDRADRGECERGWRYNGRRCVPARSNRYEYDPDPPIFSGNIVRPVMGANGQISCSNPRYTWQDGACKPYRGP